MEVQEHYQEMIDELQADHKQAKGRIELLEDRVNQL